jgi:2-methylcitrate dehydratase
MSGPAEILEGERGLLAAIGRKPDDDALHALTASADHWHILDVAVKPYPSIGTSQGAVAATLALTREHRLTPDDVEAVEVRFADLPITHSQIGDAARADPQTRETADHSFPFLVAVAIEDGDLGPAQFADERWRRPATRELMRRVTMAADPRLNSHTRNGYPAAVTIRTRAGQTLHLDMLEVPGSPWNPLTDQQIGEKLRRFAPRTLPESSVATLERRLLQLDELPDVSELGPYLRGSAS